MATQHTTQPTTGAYNPQYAKPAGRNTSAWRSSFLSPLLYFLGSCCWLAGAALNLQQPRTGFDFNDGRFDAAGILYIIAACLFIIASLVSLVSAYAEVSLLKVGGRVPGIGRILILAAWLELLGSIMLLIAAAIFLGGSNCGAFNFGAPGGATFNGGCGTASAGAILFLIGSFIWLVSMLLYTVLALVVSSVTALMPEMLHRQRAWFSIASTIFFTIGWIFFVLGAAAYVTLTAPGFLLFGSLLWLVASCLWVVSFLIRMCSSWYYFVPILSFATAAAATSGLVAGTAAQAGVGGTKAGMMTTGEAKDGHYVQQQAAAPAAAAGATQAHMVTTQQATTTQQTAVTQQAAAPAGATDASLQNVQVAV